jgi:hypothetical protein
MGGGSGSESVRFQIRSYGGLFSEMDIVEEHRTYLEPLPRLTLASDTQMSLIGWVLPEGGNSRREWPSMHSSASSLGGSRIFARSVVPIEPGFVDILQVDVSGGESKAGDRTKLQGNPPRLRRPDRPSALFRFASRPPAHSWLDYLNSSPGLQSRHDIC